MAWRHDLKDLSSVTGAILGDGQGKGSITDDDAPRITSPPPGSTLSSSTVTFTWSSASAGRQAAIDQRRPACQFRPSSPARRAGGFAIADLLLFLPALLTRLVIGQAFFLTGRGKLQNFENTVSFFTDLGIPMPKLNAAFISRLEYYGGMLLIAGLLTRIVAALLGTTMIVALLTADRETFVKALSGVGEVGLTDVTPFVYGLFLLWLLTYGPGALSLDAPLARLLRIRRQPEPAPPATA